MAGSRVRILLVEDDSRVRRVLGIALRSDGYEVIDAPDGTSAVQRLTTDKVDVVVLDLMLPDIDGFEVCRRIRAEFDVPIVVASAKGDSHDIVAGLEAGADDYVVKPVVAKELSARIRAVLRRSDPQPAPARTATGELEVLPREGLVLRNGEKVRLTTTEFRLLEHLAEHLGEVVSRESLLERLWGSDFVDDTRLVDVHVSRLRSKIEDNPSHPRHLLTVRGLGYKLSR